ncbi:hypothetical protein [Pelagibacterium halotolerans]|uniref:Uncharacterized protein n=1 Tax=Pelagibacterium halotolerans (strain DSM 22347 / JCM 15775 / CGMCC 1.7692 / B2) TaxID=1082931 RepID=G4R9L9_PELHB|nr:hypothetical protein [Pelagibacterium halotolerans]AEQ50439.1 hypothetical protein KKY_395 [Pelagibacterium halotolerans B2]QJR19595.1 hypothetical protein HKM20_14815 [Pelagibacterium halotolerans]SDZ87107.1 hypothetical protein SAMN05428936_101328 [Pelagibacterium halotolerans]
MRVPVAMVIGVLGSAFASPALSQGFSNIEAINRCDAYIESAIRPEISDSFKERFKITCYFGLIDPLIHEDHEGVCKRTSSAFSGPAGELAELMCRGAYQSYLDENGPAQ